MERVNKSLVKWVVTVSSLLIIFVVMLFGSFFIIKEGSVGIVTKLGKAEYVVYPGLNFKIPFINGVEEIEIRQRKFVASDLKATTKEQLNISAQVSLNWTVNKGSEMDLFIHYGTLAQFEDRILAPKLSSAAKQALARYSSEELTQDRNKAINSILEEMEVVMKGFPVTINSPQIENIAFPQTYLDAVLRKEEAKQAEYTAQHLLNKQNYDAQQKVNTANAEAVAIKAKADAEAYSIIKVAEAEAQAIFLVSEQLKGSSNNYLELQKVKKWTGTLPQTLLTPDGQEKLILPIK